MKRIIYGINPVREALSLKAAIEKIFISDRRKDRLVEEIITNARVKNVEIKRVNPDELEKISGTRLHQGVIACLSADYSYYHIDDLISAWKASGEAAFFLILDSVQDPQNFGSLVRCAHAAGIHGIIIPKDRACEITPAVVKASAGATEHTKISMVVNIRDAIKHLKEQGVWIVGVEADSPENIYSLSLDMDVAVVIGSEGKGIRRLIKEECDFLSYIPMRGALNSLNAAQAGCVALFEVRRQRDAAKG